MGKGEGHKGRRLGRSESVYASQPSLARRVSVCRVVTVVRNLAAGGAGLHAGASLVR